MANKVYPKFKASGHTGAADTNLLAGVVKVVLVDAGGYTYDDAHEFLSDIPAGARIAISNALASKVMTPMAAFQSGNARLDGVTGLSIECVVIVIDTGAPGTTRLVAFYDTGVTGLPVTPGGESYNVIPDAAGWFVL